MSASRPADEVFDVLMADAEGPCKVLMTKVISALESGGRDPALAAWCRVHAILREGAGAQDAADCLREAARRLSLEAKPISTAA